MPVAENYEIPGRADGSSATPEPPNQGAELALRDLLVAVRACRHCADLPLGPRPILRAETSARVLIVGQAPGTRVHASGIPWDDPSGDRLRGWLGLDKETFYDASRIAIVPMGFCYPGRGRGGDLPPRAECAPLWHGRILELLHNVRLTLFDRPSCAGILLGRQGGISDGARAALAGGTGATGAAGASLPAQSALADATSLVRSRGGAGGASAPACIAGRSLMAVPAAAQALTMVLRHGCHYHWVRLEQGRRLQ